MYDVPDRDPNPPDKYVDVPHCPECDYDVIGLKVIQMAFFTVSGWDNHEPISRTDEDWDDIGYGDPKYYCPSCGAEFDQPEWREELA